MFNRPSISTDQFHGDYLNESSDNLEITSDKESTTDTNIIINFMKEKSIK
jgi:hypothetical protein